MTYLPHGGRGWAKVIAGVHFPSLALALLTNKSFRVLTNIKTREPLQKKGAGSLIIKWGLDQAAKEGVPAYLEAATQAKHLYEQHGFREISRQTVDCTQFGMPGVVFELARMRADPK